MTRHGGDLRLLRCPVCGREVMKPAHVKTCSRTCAIVARKQTVVECVCKVCGKPFRHEGYMAAAQICPECKKQANGQRLVWLICPVCDKRVLRQARYKTCSRECGNLLQWAPRKKWGSKRERVLAKCARRRMRMRNNEGAIERIDPDEIYKRDGGRCGICGGHVEPEDVSIDHITPLSLGGEHTESNVRLTHLLCNVRRGNRVAALQVLAK